jgi:Ni2+-binding GTPase involved in maturation of urease and hydrogenase
MQPARFIVIGGFLGAGKTTALLQLASRLHAQGRKVGLITNDQAPNLVDTGMLRVRALRVEEVAGACFCCKFDDLVEAAERIRNDAIPDVIIGEPVGSCTDLTATVVQPLRRLYGDRYRVAPYSVLVDPVRARQIVCERGFGGFSAKVAYIFLKQLEEADVICLNKVDLLTAAARDGLLQALRTEFPKAQVLATSALTSAGYEPWLRLLEGACDDAGKNIADVDYDVYAEGEAELGWLNMHVEVGPGASFDPDALVRELVHNLSARLRQERREIAHLKALVETRAGCAVANDVGQEPRAGASAGGMASQARIVLNARVHADPDALHREAESVLRQVLDARGLPWRVHAKAHFRPGRPVPIHRVAR